MAFEYYIRNGKKQMRCGYTTGTCAALAAQAAARILLLSETPEHVALRTPKGIVVDVEVSECGREGDTAWAAIQKDAGDDPDITDGAMVYAYVRFLRDSNEPCATGSWGAPAAGEKDNFAADSAGRAARNNDNSAEPEIVIRGGLGVGRVTKPGLDQPVGEAAINSGPRKMIREAVRSVWQLAGESEIPAVCRTECSQEAGAKERPADGQDPAAFSRACLEVEIRIPAGVELAKKTFNPMLGIEGGISVLGTSGIVEPMSEQALIDTISVQLHQARQESDRLILTPGNYGQDFAEARGYNAYGYPVVQCSNYLGEALDMIGTEGFREVLLIGHIGKLVKVAGAIMNMHSRMADSRMEIFCAHAAICGAGTEICRQLMKAVTTDACIEILDGCGLREEVLTSILTAIQAKIDRRAGGEYRIGAIIFSNVYGLLGKSETAQELERAWGGAPEAE